MLLTYLSWDRKDLEIPALLVSMVQGTSSGDGAKDICKLEERCDEDEGSATSNIAVGLSRAYFKESLELHRTDTFQTPKQFFLFRVKKSFSISQIFLFLEENKY